MADPRLRDAVEAGGTLLVPGIHDLLSAKVADGLGFPALFVTGNGLSASHLGLPDAGFAGYADVVPRVAAMAEAVRTPLIVDGDTGFGGLASLRRTVRGMERAGASALQIEDQVFPKRCGHAGRPPQVVATDEMLRRIGVALESRESDAFLIVARTDARAGLGLAAALDRAAACAEAGADLVFVEGPRDTAEMRAVAERVSAPLVANLVPGGRSPVLPLEHVRSLGYAIALHPALGLLATVAALRNAYGTLAATGASPESGLEDFAAFGRLMGLEEVEAFDARWAAWPDRKGEGPDGV